MKIHLWVNPLYKHCYSYPFSSTDWLFFLLNLAGGELDKSFVTRELELLANFCFDVVLMLISLTQGGRKYTFAPRGRLDYTIQDPPHSCNHGNN